MFANEKLRFKVKYSSGCGTCAREKCPSLSGSEHASQQTISWSFCGSYTLIFSCLASCHTSLVFPPGGGGGGVTFGER